MDDSSDDEDCTHCAKTHAPQHAQQHAQKQAQQQAQQQEEQGFQLPPTEPLTTELPRELLKYHLGKELADAVIGCVLVCSLLFQVIQMQMRAPTAERMNPQMFPPLLKTTSFLASTPYTHQMQVNSDLHNYQLACERGEAPYKYPVQAEREKCVEALNHPPRTKRPADAGGSSSSVEGRLPEKIIVEGNAAAMRSWRPCYSCAVCSPVASGKTAIALVMIICRAMSTAFVTNKPKNAEQVLKFIVEHTNILFYIPVNLLSMNLSKNQHVKSRMTIPGLGKYKFMRHFFMGSEAGIVIMDRNLFMPPADKTVDDRKDCIYQANYSDYDLLIIDEATDNATPKFVEAIEGQMLVQGHMDGLDKKFNFTIKCKYTMMVMLCGVFYRPEENGGEFLRKFPIINEPLSGSYMIRMGWIANPRYVVVLCREDGEPNECIREVSQEACKLAKASDELGNSLRKLATNRMLVLDSILRFHTTMNHKIIVFCERVEIVKTLHNLYGNSQTMDGNTPDDHRREIFKNFENPESGLNILITTNICGVGLDIPRIQVTVNISPYNTPAQERQRSGRSERRCAEVSKPGQPKAAWNYSISPESDVVFAEDGVTVRKLPDRMSLIKVDGLEDNIMVVREKELVQRLDTAMNTAIGTASTFAEFQGIPPQDIMPPKLMGDAHQRSIFLLKTVMAMSKSKLATKQKDTKAPETKTSGKAKSSNPDFRGNPENTIVKQINKKRQGLMRLQKKQESAQKQKRKTSSNADLPSEPSSSHGNEGALIIVDDSIERADDHVQQMIDKLVATAGIPQHASLSELSKMISRQILMFEEEFNRATCDNVLRARRLVKANATVNPNLPWEARAEDFYF